MPGAFLALLIALAAAWVAAAALRDRPLAARLVHASVAGAGLLLLGFGLAALLGGGWAMRLPLGPPGADLSLALDPLGAWFLLALGVSSAIAGFAGVTLEPAAPPRRLAPVPLFVAAMAVTLAARDGLTLLLGFEAMSLASWALVAADRESPTHREAARLYLVFACFSAACLLGALALAGPLGFDAWRAAPPEGWRGAAILGLVLLGAGSKAGLVPLHVWLPLAHPAAPPQVSALMSGAMTKVAVYVVARVLFDLAGPLPIAAGVPLLVAGAASAFLGALRATQETDSKTLLACSTIENIGLIAIGLGLAAVFRGADLGALAALAGAAALLHVLAHAAFKSALFCAAGAVLQEAGSRSLDRLGGLIHAMPATARLTLLLAASAAALPPLAGFAAEWLLLQALLAAWRVGDLALQITAAAALAVVGLSVALAAAAMVRFWGLVFLGRPRHPRTLGAREAGLPLRAALLLGGGLSLLLGLLPGAALRLAEPALLRLVGQGFGERAGWLALWPGDGASPYAAPAAAALLLAAVAALWRARRPIEAAEGPAWACGFSAPPAHLPFGDPALQPSAAGFAQPLRRMLAEPWLAQPERIEMPEPGDPAPARIAHRIEDPALRWLLRPAGRLRDAAAARAERLRDITIRQALALGFAGLLLLLALLAWAEA